MFKLDSSNLPAKALAMGEILYYTVYKLKKDNNMPTGHMMMAMSLDGFIARLDYSLDWLFKQPTQDEEHGFDAFMDSVDVIVMGTGSFKTLLGFDKWLYSRPVVVLSQSLAQDDIPMDLRTKVELSTETPSALMDRFNAAGYKRIYVDGGAVSRSFIKLGFVQSMKITIVPILIGEGLRLFGQLGKDIDLKLENVSTFPSGLVTLDYELE